MLRLGSPALHNIAEWVGKQRQDSSIQLPYSKQLRNSPQHYSTVVYDLSSNTGLTGNHQLSLLPIGRSQIVRQKSSKNFNSTLQFLANDFDKNGGRTNVIANKGCAYSRNNSSEYARNNSNRKYSLNKIIKQRKTDEVSKNDSSGQTRSNLYTKKEVSFISITNTDGNFSKRPWHDPNFKVNQNGVMANFTRNEQTEENCKETASAEGVPRGPSQNQECPRIKNIDDTKAIQTYPEILSPKKKTDLFEKSSVEPLLGKFASSSLAKTHSTKPHTAKQNIQASYTADCCSQQATKLEKTAQDASDRLAWHLEKTPNIKTQQKILQPTPPNNQTPVHGARVMTKLVRNNLDENNNSDIKGNEGQKVINQTFRRRLQKFENSSPNAKIKMSFPGSPLSSKLKQESKSFNKKNTFPTAVPETRDCTHSTLRKPELNQFPFNPMHTAQISRFSRSHTEEDCENDKNNGILTLNAKNLTLFDIFTSKGSSKVESKNRRIYRWLEECHRHPREILFRDLETKMNN